MTDAELLKDIKNIVKWTEESIKANELIGSMKMVCESSAYTIIKEKIEEANNGQSS